LQDLLLSDTNAFNRASDKPHNLAMFHMTRSTIMYFMNAHQLVIRPMKVSADDMVLS